ncbi:MAG TPA: phosphohydrolase, partial [Promineifilum sp.]|nr:phosphohydrolase [Promineifilum sp.]
GYSAGQIETVCGIIAATRLPQRPENLLQELMCDADLDLLGRDDFMKLNYELLMEVRRVTGRLISDTDWLRAQVQFLCNHRYFTAAARASRAEGEKRNIALLDAALALH